MFIRHFSLKGINLGNNQIVFSPNNCTEIEIWREERIKLFMSWILQSKEDIRSSSILRMFYITLDIYVMLYSLQRILTCTVSHGPKLFLSEEDH